jgi:ketosteroid isomerase-like protein
MTAPTTIDPSQLPAVVREYLAAHTAKDADTAIRSYTADALVVDDGRAYRGTEEIIAWLRDAATEYRYTVELTGAQRIDDEHWVAFLHLEGDFPGGVADLRYGLVLRDDRISQLTITA